METYKPSDRLCCDEDLGRKLAVAELEVLHLNEVIKQATHKYAEDVKKLEEKVEHAALVGRRVVEACVRPVCHTGSFVSTDKDEGPLHQQPEEEVSEGERAEPGKTAAHRDAGEIPR